MSQAEPSCAALPRTPLWNGGWYRFSHRLQSPNQEARPDGALVDLIVMHSISLPPGCYGGDEVQRLFTNRLDWNAHPYFQSIKGARVSAHFYVRRRGELWQFVSCDERAWHAGVSSYRGRGNCNDDSIGVEFEGLEGCGFEAAQYETVAALCAAIGQQYPIAHVAGHQHIAPGRKSDPGSGFDWAQLQRSLAWRPQCFPDAGAPQAAS